MSRSEAHLHLQRSASLWAFARGYRCCATEVRVPLSSFRVDVAAYRKSRDECKPVVAIFECKQSRQDLFRDNAKRLLLSERLNLLETRRLNLERLLAVHHPSLQVSESLFSEWATYDFTRIDHQGYQQTVRKISRIQKQLMDNTKFDQLTNYELANLHYLVTSHGLVSSSEVPLGWGHLELDDSGQLVEKCLPRRCRGVDPTMWLFQVAKALTSQTMTRLSQNQPAPEMNRALSLESGVRS